jgi:hypothetical protein
MTVRIFLGYANGIFANYMTYFQGIFRSLDLMKVGDFNNDGRLDILMIMNAHFYIILALGSGEETFNLPLYQLVSTSNFPQYITVGDFIHFGAK